MEVIIFSNNPEKSKDIQKITDRIIMDKRMRLMSLHTSIPSDASELMKCFKNDKGYLVIIDISEIKDWKKLIKNVSEKNRLVKFCVMAKNNDAASELINMMINTCGYINTALDSLKSMFEDILSRLYSRVATLCGGLLVTADNGGLKVINYDSIYYIETLKQQHRCTIVHNNGSDIMRADISKLIKSLDNRFEITRSSTIANLSRVNGINDGMLTFGNGVYCSVTSQKLSEIKKIMRETVIV